MLQNADSIGMLLPQASKAAKKNQPIVHHLYWSPTKAWSLKIANLPRVTLNYCGEP